MAKAIATLFVGDNVEVMRRVIAYASIQLTVTSPPYDNLRKYNGFAWDFEAVARELYCVTKPGGVVVWVVGDATINGSETGTSFRQALYFKECGFNLHDTMIYRKACQTPLNHRRYEQEWEYMFVFSKGTPLVFNPLRVSCKFAGQMPWGKPKVYKSDDGKLTEIERKPMGETKIKGNIFEYRPGSTQTHGKHPAPFPEGLAQDHILSWSNPGDTVLDPFCGSGTTGKMALLNSRNFIGIDISPEYVELSRSRILGASIGSTGDAPMAVNSPATVSSFEMFNHILGGKTDG
jgi:DNA modification methylase